MEAAALCVCVACYYYLQSIPLSTVSSSLSSEFPRSRLLLSTRGVAMAFMKFNSFFVIPLVCFWVFVGFFVWFLLQSFAKKKKKKSFHLLQFFSWTEDFLLVIDSDFLSFRLFCDFFLRTLILKWLATFLVCFVDVEAPSEWFSFFPILKLRFSYLLLILHFLLLLFLPLLGLFVEYWKKSFGDVLANSTRSAYCCYCQKWFVWSLWGALFVFGNYLRFFEGLIEFRRKMGKRTEGEIKL